MRLHVHEWGRLDSPPIVCLHGVAAHGFRFRKLAEERLGDRFRIVAPDLRGHGRSGWEPPWRIDTYVGDLLETVDALGIERADWLGHSFGGRLSLELAARAPERVGRVILLDPAIRIDPAQALANAEAERVEKTYASEEVAIEARLAESETTPRSFAEEDVRVHYVAGEDGRLRLRYCQAAVVALWSEMATEPPPFERIRAPVLAVYAPAAEFLSPADAKALRDALGDRLELVEVPGSHMVLWDAYEQAAVAIERFLRPSRSQRGRIPASS